MALDVIGTGFSRTGTSSMRAALQTLGFDPCHHMEAVLSDPTRVGAWTSYSQGTPLDVESVFAGFRAQVDFPGVAVWRDLILHYPDAKVVHSIRPAESWWKSFDATVGLFLSRYRDLALPPHVVDMMLAMDVVMGERVFGGNHRDKSTAIAAYTAHNDSIIAAIPPDRLLVYDVAQGWDPLCRFLGVSVPDVAFPRLNDSAEFWKENGGPPA